MIRAWGGWELFQELLAVLKEIATRREVDVSNVAARWVLDRPETGVVIVGELDNLSILIDVHLTDGF